MLSNRLELRMQCNYCPGHMGDEASHRENCIYSVEAGLAAAIRLTRYGLNTKYKNGNIYVGGKLIPREKAFEALEILKDA